jgi:hypothetical protein
MEKKIPTRTEFFTFDTAQTLVIDDAGEITFINNGGLNSNVIINNVLTLSSILTASSIPVSFPSSFNVKMNSGEVDLTNYTIRFTGVTARSLLVIVKTYLKQ